MDARRRPRCPRLRTPALLAATTGLVLAAGCTPGAPPVPPGGVELTFTPAALGVRHNPEPGPHATWTSDEGELRRLWADPDLWSQADPGDLTVPGEQVAVVVDAEYLHHGTEVVQVVEVDGTWLVRLEGHAKAACTLPDVVQADVHLLLVEADEPPTTVEQEIEVLRGCGDG